MLSKATHHYPVHDLETGAALVDDPRQVYFPDSVVNSFLAIRPPIGESAPPRISEPRFTLEEAKTLIVNALENFDPVLGSRARDLFTTALYRGGGVDEKLEKSYRNMAYADPPQTENPYIQPSYELPVEKGQRWNISPVPPEQSRLMRCLPQNSAGDAYNPANPHDEAVIEFEFDGTIGGVIYMAHESGHALAFDAIREKGFKPEDSPRHMDETQAYFVQHIVTEALLHHTSPAIAQAARMHRAIETTNALHILPEAVNALKQGEAWLLHGRPMGYLSAAVLANQLKESSAQSRRWGIKSILGAAGPRGIATVMADAGIERQEDLELAARSTVATALQYLLERDSRHDSAHEKTGPV